MQTRQLGSNGPRVSSLGLGCMGMTPIYATPDPNEAIATIHAAVDAGITLIDTADMYAGGKNEELIGRAIASIRERVVLASKFGNMRLPDGKRKVNGKPEYVFEACDKSLARLGVDHIDLYYLHRMDPTVPIEDTVGAMAQLIEQGKVGAIGLSEAGANTIHRAHATHPLAAVQTEYSLATRDVETEILPTCRELGIGFVAYSPLSRGLLSGEITSLDQLGENDRRRDMPRFQADNLANNLAMVKAIGEIAADKGVSTAAIAIAWVLSRGDDVVPIPGCSRRSTLQNSLTALEVELSAADIGAIEAALDADRIIGTRYPEPQMARLGI
ncbi:MAG TPA: aldo/keto reductase [Gammaproteobacteria bacterium]|nr:aldo/keto reductase [Gammaproteobacteria bacterium]